MPNSLLLMDFRGGKGWQIFQKCQNRLNAPKYVPKSVLESTKAIQVGLKTVPENSQILISDPPLF